MLSPPPESHRSKLLLEYQELCSNSNIQFKERHEEVLAVWFASPFIKRVCFSQPNWLESNYANNTLHQDFDRDDYEIELATVFSAANSVEELRHLLRRTRAAAFARIAWRDLQSYSTVEQTLYELSLFADICLQKNMNWCFQWLQSRPSTGEFEKSLENSIVIFALGKLGGSELNFSSDVDVVFAYSDDGTYNQEQHAKLTEFNLKAVQLFIKVLSEQTQDGFVFRVDTRLRPFGESGPLLPSFSSIDQYFQVHGRDWERYAWMKARVVAGDVQKGQDFLQEISPFIYRRYLDYGAMQSLREMKTLIENKAQLSFQNDDLKIGVGGIREIEFIAQMFQLIYGGRNSTLRIRSTQQALAKLQEQGFISQEWAECLLKAYLFLRKAENVLQMREDQQIHCLPSKAEQQERFGYAIGMQSWEVFHDEYKQHATIVNDIYQTLLMRDEAESVNNEYANVWLQIEEHDFCIEILARNFADNAEYIYKQLASFQKSDYVRKMVPIARKRLDQFMPTFLQELEKFNDSSVILDRFLKILEKISQRSTYIALLIENKNKLSMIFKLICHSQWVSQYLATHPLLIDDVLSISDDYAPPDKKEMQQQLLTNLAGADDLEKFMENLREFKHSQVIQIAAADILQNYPIMKVSDHLSWLAEICVNHALQYAYSDLTQKYGEPQCINNGKTYKPEVLIVEYGKLGGLELGYGSDLDMVFLHNSVGEHCETSGSEQDGKKKIHNDIFFTRLVQRTIHILSTATPGGKVFDVDLRLRPHGESGPVTTSISAYEHYLINDAWMWEHQALVRARGITSSAKLAEEFIVTRKKILTLSRNIEEVRASVVEMRNKMLDAEKNNAESFNIKKNLGGVIDIEFIVQFLVLSHSQNHPKLAEHTDNIRILDACCAVGLLSTSVAHKLKEIYLEYRKYLHQLSLQLLPAEIDKDVFLKERDTVQKIWATLLHSDTA